MKKILLILFLLCQVSYVYATSTMFQQKLKELEISSGGRVGVYAIDTANGDILQYHAKERFPTGCTSKVIGVATILKQSMQDKNLLQQKIFYSEKDLTSWSPITKLHSTMTVAELCAAAISYSDNTAMNLLVKKMGGLLEMNNFARFIGNDSFRQDNTWPAEAYSGGVGNLKDSSTPKDMAKSLQKLLFTNVLAKYQQRLLISWLKATVTGPMRIKAGVPKNWSVAHKTGTNANYGTTNDLGVIWPSKCAPIIVAIYYTNYDKNADTKDEIIASVTRILVDNFANKNSCIRGLLTIGSTAKNQANLRKFQLELVK